MREPVAIENIGNFLQWLGADILKEEGDLRDRTRPSQESDSKPRQALVHPVSGYGERHDPELRRYHSLMPRRSIMSPANPSVA